MLRHSLLSLHLVAVISWMAGILYLYRLFVYHAEETEPLVQARFRVMEQRLYRYITKPAMAAAVLAGLALVQTNLTYYLNSGWLYAKLALVTGLIVSTGYAGRTVRLLSEDAKIRSGRHYRIMNEVPTLLMIGIVVLVVFKPF